MLATSASAQEPVRFLVSSAWSMPVGELRTQGGQQQLVAGIMKEWQEQLAAALQRPVALVIVPRKREAAVALAGAADLRCFMSPDWVRSEPADLYDWPPPIITIEERLVGHRSKPLIASSDELRDVRLGTVAGYHYPSLALALQRQNVRRDDAPTESAAFAKQLAGRVDYTVMRDIDFRYLKAVRREAVAHLMMSPLVVASTPVHCARIRAGSVPLPDLLAAQEKLIKQGVLGVIRARYAQ
ncbi:MAG: ABC transporter substrate-binding protein [Burkholderiaceae bacterium]|nr:ABC transporter substrate-binding protein [Burkholderiaceae bacterium]